MNVKEQVETVFKLYKTPKAPYKARDLISRMIFGMSYAHALTAESSGHELPIELNFDLSQLILTHGPWVPDLFDVVLTTIVPLTNSAGLQFAVGQDYYVTNEALSMTSLMSERWKKNPNGSIHDLVKELLSLEVVEEIEAPTKLIIRYAF